MNDLLANTDGYNLGTGCIVPNFMSPNIISIPLDGGYQLQVGYVKRSDVFLTDEMKVYIDLLLKALEGSAPGSM
ncbi:hypothetical protein D3C73_1460490 [compost metagenome]